MKPYRSCTNLGVASILIAFFVFASHLQAATNARILLANAAARRSQRLHIVDSSEMRRDRRTLAVCQYVCRTFIYITVPGIPIKFFDWKSQPTLTDVFTL